jgi:hypothetical protein
MTSILSRGWLFGLVLAVGCSGPKAPVNTERKPLEERRARAVIERVAEEHGSTAKPGRTFELSNGFRLMEEVRLGDGPYGVAYITAEERSEAGRALPKYDPENTALRVLHPSEDAIILVLHDEAYRFDPTGADLADTAVTAEKTFERDVADFIVNVVATGAGRRKRAGEQP